MGGVHVQVVAHDEVDKNDLGTTSGKELWVRFQSPLNSVTVISGSRLPPLLRQNSWCQISGHGGKELHAFFS